MKKILLAGALFMFAATGSVWAQGVSEVVVTKSRPTEDKKDKWIEIESFSWGATNAAGAQTVVVPKGKGILKFEKNGNRFTNVVFIDASGRSHQLQPAAAGTNGAPKPACKYLLPDACFATADKNIGMCMCKPTDLNSNSPYTVTLLLPAIQKIRDAALKK